MIFKSSFDTIQFLVELIVNVHTQFKVISSFEKITQLVLVSHSSTNASVTSNVFLESVVVINTLSACLT
ncbi:hypothetical protein IKN40_04990 [bacterium]|nr:hypothetical protein [bacterium]